MFTIDPVGMIEGAFPKRQRRLVEALGEIHQEELMVAWYRLQGGQLPDRIEPLQ